MVVSVPLTSAGIPSTDALPKSDWQATPEEAKFLSKKAKRISVLINHRKKFEDGMREGIMLYEGKSIVIKNDKRDLDVVMPIARQFVEAKTSEEVTTMNTFEYGGIPGATSTWRVKIMKELTDHVQRRVKLRGKRSEIIRMKNICGTSIVRLGYRKIMRTIKERVEGDEDAINVTYNKVTVPMYDDLFLDVVSPLNFAVDPNSKTMDDAMDCYHVHYENWETFHDVYGNDPRFKNVDKVKPGVKFKFDNSGNFVYDCTVQDEGVMVEEYFCKPLDEWVFIANGVLITDIDNPLPDDHKELPFISYHNSAQFIVSMSALAGLVQSKDVSMIEKVYAEQGFWCKGDPMVIKDLIDLNTGFTRAMFRNAKLAGQTIIATADGCKFNEGRNWRDGDQAEGMMDKFQAVPMTTSTFANTMPVIEYLFRQSVLSIGVDPNNLSGDGSQKTATEAAIIRETAAKRLEEGIAFNEENGETRLGTLMLKASEQYYSMPETVRLTGLENDKDLKKYDDVKYSANTNLPLYGERTRRISTGTLYKETKKKKPDGTYKYYLTESEEGSNSFLARPEFIRSSDILVTVSSLRSVTQIKAVQIAQIKEALELLAQFYPLTLPQQPGQEPVIKREQLPDPAPLFSDYLKLLGRDPGSSITSGDKKEQAEEDQVIQKMTADRPGITPDMVSMAQQAMQQIQQAPTQSPQVNANSAPQ